MSLLAAAALTVAGVTVTVGAALLLIRRNSTLATVTGQSMSPTFAHGERVFALRRRAYQVGDVIVFRPTAPTAAGTPAWRIKRVAATAGDPIPAWLRVDDDLPDGRGLPDRVPARHVVVIGDSPRSENSRQLGFIPVRSIAGRVVPARPAPVAPPTR